MTIDKNRFFQWGFYVLLGALLAMILTQLSLNPFDYLNDEIVKADSLTNEDGQFPCWWIDDLMSSEDYESFSDYFKDIIYLQKKWCFDEPKPEEFIEVPVMGG